MWMRVRVRVPVSADEAVLVDAVLPPRWCSGIRCMLTSATVGKFKSVFVFSVVVLLPATLGLAVIVLVIESCNKKANDDDSDIDETARRKRQDLAVLRETMNAGRMLPQEPWDRAFILFDGWMQIYR